MRPYASGKLIVVFGAGGDRDAGKRPIMGRIAAENADRVIVTDDNPRSEQPSAIRAAILAAAPGASEIGDRTQAIRAAIASLQAGDVLLIAGKGHETGQIVGDTVISVLRSRRGRRGLAGQCGMSALWTIDAMAAAMRADKSGALPADVPGLSIDSRNMTKGEAFFAITGDSRDGHDFVEAALKAGAGVAVVARAKRAQFAADAPLLAVDDVLEALRDLARAARARSLAKIVAVTGSVGKTSTKEALRLALAADGETHASAASYNNHWGVPLSLARLPASARYAVFEIGMNHAGEITPLTKLVRPHVAIVTAIAPVHLEYFGSLKKIADAKAEIFLGLEPGGTAVLNRDNRQYAQLVRAAVAAGVARVVSFGASAKASARLLRYSLQTECSTVEARILGQPVTYKLGAPGKHLVLNSLAVLAAVALVGADLALAALALDNLKPATRPRHPRHLAGARRQRAFDRRELQCQPGLHGGSHRTARPGRGRRPGPPYRRARRHAGTGRAGAGAAPRAGRADPGCRRRPGVLQRAADARAVGGPSLSEPGRLCRDRGGAGAGRARRHPQRRCGDGEGFAGLENGADRQGAGTAIR